MPTIYIRIWDARDNEILMPYTFGIKKVAKKNKEIINPIKSLWIYLKNKLNPVKRRVIRKCRCLV